jgi:DNA-binding transcriptional MerR regulator
MNLDQSLFENTDVTAATGLSPSTIQTWANRGILMLSKQQRNPGPGQKRMYTSLDIVRIAVTQSLIDYGLKASTAGRIAYRLERGCVAQWRQALQNSAPHIYIFVVDDFNVADVYTGNDSRTVGDKLNGLSEDCKGGPPGATNTIRTKTAVFDVGPRVNPVLQFLNASGSHKKQ